MSIGIAPDKWENRSMASSRRPRRSSWNGISLVYSCTLLEAVVFLEPSIY